MQDRWKGIYMNEQQRLDTTNAVKIDKKEEKDYSKYFETVYMPPSLKDAKKRGKEAIN